MAQRRNCQVLKFFTFVWRDAKNSLFGQKMLPALLFPWRKCSACFEILAATQQT
jgi:hypothetical protein